ncbi:MAG: photosystem II stability/assembly factor-like uncharacterized protein [Paraglaciecola sp.]
MIITHLDIYPSMKKLIWILLAVCIHGLQAQQIDIELMKALRPRAIGPGGMSGRVTSVTAQKGNNNIIYAGTASGGLWKSTSGGIDWQPIFEQEKAASIGVVAIDPTNPSVLWVGTGEGNPRNSQTQGYGIYKSLDGGKSWMLMGLETTRAIHRIAIHPTNPNIVYAGVFGSQWGDHEDRGVYRTMDGGKTWKRILFVNSSTGVADMVMDPSNPNKLIVAMWQFRRDPWFFKSGGPGSGLYITMDGGDNWTQKTSSAGLPEGELGRIGLAIAPSEPNIIYALIESNKNALYRSDDGGQSWKVQAEKGIGNRPFYYADIYVDPQNENRIYNLWTFVTVSEDGGKTFENLLPWNNSANNIHVDHHAWYIDPDDTNFMLDGNDGGLAISRDRGKKWRFVENLPLGQYYHINVDNEVPYNIYGGMQDNGSWKGPSQIWGNGMIRNHYWEELAFGDGFDVIPDQSDNNYVYAMSQKGNLHRYDTRTGEQKFIKPVHPDGEFLRFNWNAGIAHDPHNNQTLYFGSQYLHKSDDQGATWSIISPDLTTNDPAKQNQTESGGLTYDVTGAENHTAILTIAPSSIDKNVIWVGTDDGNIQLTQNGGVSWENVATKLKGVPSSSWVSQIQASTYDPAEAFVVINNYRREDWGLYIYRTKDYGKSWSQIASPSQVWGYGLSIIQDPVTPNLLFLGTEFGMYASIDNAKNWTKWTAGFPTVSTMDMVIQSESADLVVGTFGRSTFVFDDIRPLRALAKSGSQLLQEPVSIFQPADAYLAIWKEAFGTRCAGDGMYFGENKAYGALITYVLNEKDSIKVEIIDTNNRVVRTLQLSGEKGMNRFVWGLDRKGVSSPIQEAGDFEPAGPVVMPGTYTVKLTRGSATSETTLKVKLDPRKTVSIEDLAARNNFIESFLTLRQTAVDLEKRLNDSEKLLTKVENLLKNPANSTVDLTADLKEHKQSIKDLRTLINPPKDVQGIYRDPLIVSSRLGQTSNYVLSSAIKMSAWEAPSPNEKLEMKYTRAAVEKANQKIEDYFEASWNPFVAKVKSLDLTLFE